MRYAAESAIISLVQDPHRQERTDHLGCAAEGEAPDVSGHQVDPCVGHCNVAGVCVHQALVVHLRMDASVSEPRIARLAHPSSAVMMEKG